MKPLLLVCFAARALCQPSFTVASVRITEFLPDKRPIVKISPGRVTLGGLTLQTLIAQAHGVKEHQVRGPDGVLRERYTIMATMPGATAEPLMWQMLQTLLAERLQLKLRRGPEEMPVYAIVAAKGGPKLKPAAGGEMSIRFRGGAIEAKNATVESLADLLGGVFDRPVVDRTGIEGAFDFSLAFTPDPALGAGMSKIAVEWEAKADAGGPSIFGALQQQLGLKLEPRKEPVEVLTVESVLKTPIEN